VGAQAIERDTAGMVTSSLLPDRPPAAGAVKRPIASKAGVSDDKKASWFIGYTPELVTSMALFGENPKTRKPIRLPDTGKNTRDLAWRWSSYTDEALRGTPPSGFDFGPVTEEKVPPVPDATRTSARQAPGR